MLRLIVTPQARHCERREAIHASDGRSRGLLRRYAPRNDGPGMLLLIVGFLLVGLASSAFAETTKKTAPPNPAPIEKPKIAKLSVPSSFADVVEPLLGAVVNVSTTNDISRSYAPELPELPEGHPFREFFKEFADEDRQQRNRPKKATALGSGFLIKCGYVVTNCHVIAEADEITVILSDGTKLPTKLVGKDKRTDLAVLKVESDKPLPFVEFGDSTKARVGDWVIAIGNPFGLSSTVTVGVISSMSRDIAAMDVGGANAADKVAAYIQTDAPMNVGNSGGALFNTGGRVIGINTAILSPSGGNVGIGFAIPSSLASAIVHKLIEFGKVERGWLGVTIQALAEEDLAESFNVTKDSGALITSVIKGSPAAKAGLKKGDVVTKFNNEKVKNSREFALFVGAVDIGKTVSMEIVRNGKQYILNVTVEKEKSLDGKGLSVEGEVTSNKILGMQLRNLSEEDDKKFGPEPRGVVVTGVSKRSVAKEKDIRKDDMILQVDHVDVSSVEEVGKLVETARKAKKKVVLLLIGRGINHWFVTLPLKEKAGQGD